VRTDITVDTATTISLGDLERQLKGALRLESATNGVDILLPRHFVSVVRGGTRARNIGPKRECRAEIMTEGEPEAGGPAAVFGSRGLGWLDTLEVVVLQVGRRTLMWKRRAEKAEVSINGKSVGRIELGWCLRYANIGSGRVWFDGNPFCQIVLPLRGPSSPQPRDCTGRFTFASERKAIKFLIAPKDLESSNGTMQSGTAVQPRAIWRSDATIFDPADEARLTHFSEDQRLLLLALAVWPWSLYKPGETKVGGAQSLK
jgi:hypothetical protein